MSVMVQNIHRTPIFGLIVCISKYSEIIIKAKLSESGKKKRTTGHNVLKLDLNMCKEEKCMTLKKKNIKNLPAHVSVCFFFPY